MYAKETEFYEQTGEIIIPECISYMKNNKENFKDFFQIQAMKEYIDICIQVKILDKSRSQLKLMKEKRKMKQLIVKTLDEDRLITNNELDNTF